MKENRETFSGIKEIHDINHLPLVIVETTNEGENNSFVAIGQSRLSDLTTKENCERMIEEKDWNLIMAVMMYLQMNEVKVKEIIKEMNKKEVKEKKEM